MNLLKKLSLIIITSLSISCVSTFTYEGTTEEQIDIIFSKHIDKPEYNEFKVKILAIYRDYLEYKPLGYKSLAIAADIGGSIVHRRAYGSNSYSYGRSFSLGKCRDDRKNAGIKGECVILAKGDRLVLESY